jgi:hypothetical protein
VFGTSFANHFWRPEAFSPWKYRSYKTKLLHFRGFSNMPQNQTYAKAKNDLKVKWFMFVYIPVNGSWTICFRLNINYRGKSSKFSIFKLKSILEAKSILPVNIQTCQNLFLLPCRICVIIGVTYRWTCCY